jgi:hypothetical protein
MLLARVRQLVVVGIIVSGLIVPGIWGCATDQVARAPADPGPPGIRTTRPTCEAPVDRPAPGRAAVEEMPEADVVLVRYSATPEDEPCETLDIHFRRRGEMLVGEPGRQVELVWTGARKVDRVTEVKLFVKDTAMTVPSALERSGSRVRISSFLPPAVLARYGSDDRPAIAFSTHKIKLSSFQIGILQRFVRHLPFHDTFSPPSSARPQATPERPVADPAAGRGWFCVEAEKPGGRKKRISSCHRTAAECEESRAAMRAKHGQAGDCISSSAALCYSWRAGTRRGESCFYRPSQCQEDMTNRGEDLGGHVPMGGCYPAD